MGHCYIIPMMSLLVLILSGGPIAWHIYCLKTPCVYHLIEEAC